MNQARWPRDGMGRGLLHEKDYFMAPDTDLRAVLFVVGSPPLRRRRSRGNGTAGLVGGSDVTPVVGVMHIPSLRKIMPAEHLARTNAHDLVSASIWRGVFDEIFDRWLNQIGHIAGRKIPAFEEQIVGVTEPKSSLLAVSQGPPFVLRRRGNPGRPAHLQVVRADLTEQPV